MAGLTADHQPIEIEDINEETNNKFKKDIVDRESGGEREMAPPAGSSSIHRTSSRPLLDLSKAAIQGNFEEKDPTILLPNQSDDLSHLALDIGGSLIKLVYFSRHEDRSVNDRRKKSLKEKFGVSNSNRRSYPILGGRLHFVKFETAKINECLDFISSKQLHRGGMDASHWNSDDPNNDNAVIKTQVQEKEYLPAPEPPPTQCSRQYQCYQNQAYLFQPPLTQTLYSVLPAIAHPWPSRTAVEEDSPTPLQSATTTG